NASFGPFPFLSSGAPNLPNKSRAPTRSGNRITTRKSRKLMSNQNTHQNTDWLDARITDEALAFMRAHIGVKRRVRPWNSLVTEDTIWHFAQGVGDDNPMWWDRAHAERSPWGRMIAPPTYLYCCYSGGRYPDDKVPSGVDMFLPGVFGVWASEK